MSKKLVVKILKSNNTVIGFDISGHANYDEHGKDIVCAGVSTLAQTTISSLVELAKIKNFKYQINEGHSYIIIDLKEVDDKVELLLESFQIGIKGIQNSYNKYIEIVKQEVDLNDQGI